LIFHAVALSLDEHGLRMMQEPIEVSVLSLLKISGQFLEAVFEVMTVDPRS
jgi:hypothetical protein